MTPATSATFPRVTAMRRGPLEVVEDESRNVLVAFMICIALVVAFGG